jgi:hypothetical protein
MARGLLPFLKGAARCGSLIKLKRSQNSLKTLLIIERMINNPQMHDYLQRSELHASLKAAILARVGVAKVFLIRAVNRQHKKNLRQLIIKKNKTKSPVVKTSRSPTATTSLKRLFLFASKIVS